MRAEFRRGQLHQPGIGTSFKLPFYPRSQNLYINDDDDDVISYM